jgi:predicted ATPase
MLLCAALIVLVDRGQPRVTKLAEERDAIRLSHDAF